MKYVKTTRGLIPLDDYLEICAMQHGFHCYEELKEEGYSIEIPESDIIEKGGNACCLQIWTEL